MESAEKALIASVFTHPNKSDSQEILLELSPDCFQGIGEGNLWTAMRELVLAGNPINETTIRQSLGTLGHLGPEGIYWPTYKDMLEQASEPIEELANEIRDNWLRRSLGALIDSRRFELSDMSLSADQIAEAIQDDITGLVSGRTKTEDPWAEIKKAYDHGETLDVMMKQGGWAFDEVNQVYQIPRGAVTFAVARPNIGKSTWGMTVARLTAEHEEGSVLWVNQDMPQGIMKLKLWSCFSGVAQWRLQKRCMTADEHKRAGEAVDILRAKVSFLHFPGMTPINSMKPQVISQIRKSKPSLLVWDQFSQIGKDKSTAKRDDAQAAYISRTIKNIAGSTETAILMLAQANRGAGTDEPSLTDIAETDAIGQDAVGVFSLWANESRARKAEDSGDLDFGAKIQTSEKFKNVPFVDCRLSKSQISEVGKLWHLYRDGEKNIFRIHTLET